MSRLLDVCAQQRVAVQTIKSVARRRWPDGYDGRRFSWYEPLADDGGAVSRAVRWVLANPQVFLNTSSDARLLPAILEAAAGGAGAPTDDDMRADVAAHGVEPLFDGSDLERI